MGYLFISYSRQQLYFAESVALHLQGAGLETWFDLHKLAPGVDWGKSLQDGYGNCERLILLASQSALRSPYVQVEWETALGNGREVIVVLAEAVVLPESLRGCAVYDARGNFKRTMGALTTYLRGETPPRYDPVPAPRDFPLPDKMPRDIWLTLSVLLMPTLTIWIAALALGRNPGLLDLSFLEHIVRYLPGSLPYVRVLLGLLAGIVVYWQLPVVKFLRHETNFEELEGTRGTLFWSQTVAALVFLASTGGAPFSFLILLFPMTTIYWSLWTLRRSPDLLRWLPSGQTDQEVRERIQGQQIAAIRKQPEAGERSAEPSDVRYALHYHPADSHNARFIDAAFRAYGCQSVSEEVSTHQLVIVTNRTSKSWLLERNASLPGQIIHILATNINTPDEIKPVLGTQWVDFRSGRTKVLQGLAATLKGRERSDVRYGMQISPTGFDTIDGFPRMMRLVLGAIVVVSTLVFVAIVSTIKLAADWMFFLFIIPYLILLFFYVDALIMRRGSLPGVIHRILKQRVAWFASPAPPALDPIGNSDRKYLTDPKFLMFVDWLRR